MSSVKMWGIVNYRDDFLCAVRRTRTEAIKAFVGPEADYPKRWRRVKAWSTNHRVVPVTVTWAEKKGRKK